MSKKIKYIFFFSLIIALLTISSIDEELFKINKSFELLGEVYKNLNDYYVDELDPEILFNAAINGMLSELDPYTEFYSEKNEEQVEYLKTGEYIGFGLSVESKQGKLTITDLIDGYSAAKSGMRIGDRLYQIDSTIVIDKSPETIRKFSQGEIGEEANFKIIRDGLNDTLNFTLTRMKIKLRDVKFTEILEDSIGYIKLERFSNEASETFKYELSKLYKTGKLKSLIIDLRDNPGGLMIEALEICELFVPQNTTIVTLKNRFGEVKEYKTYSKPIYPNLPLVVLINNRTASASEIIAGALQDLDRAVIIGEKSFGKGLVQSVISLPYDSYLKLTTAKYYTPSGRCLQRVQYGKKEIHHDEVFYTKNGREVQESIGIIPDSTVKQIEVNTVIQDLKLNDCFFNFANYYSSKYNSFPKNFDNKEEVFNNFVQFLKKNLYFDKTTIASKIRDIEQISSDENMNSEIQDEIKKLKSMLFNSHQKNLENHKDKIYQEIKDEVFKRFYPNHEYLSYKLKTDNYVILAKQLMKKENYRKILKISED